MVLAILSALGLKTPFSPNSHRKFKLPQISRNAPPRLCSVQVKRRTMDWYMECRRHPKRYLMSLELPTSGPGSYPYEDAQMYLSSLRRHHLWGYDRRNAGPEYSLTLALVFLKCSLSHKQDICMTITNRDRVLWARCPRHASQKYRTIIRYVGPEANQDLPLCGPVIVKVVRSERWHRYDPCFEVHRQFLPLTPLNRILRVPVRKLQARGSRYVTVKSNVHIMVTQPCVYLALQHQSLLQPTPDIVSLREVQQLHNPATKPVFKIAQCPMRKQQHRTDLQYKGRSLYNPCGVLRWPLSLPSLLRQPAATSYDTGVKRHPRR